MGRSVNGSRPRRTPANWLRNDMANCPSTSCAGLGDPGVTNTVSFYLFLPYAGGDSLNTASSTSTGRLLESRIGGRLRAPGDVLQELRTTSTVRINGPYYGSAGMTHWLREHRPDPLRCCWPGLARLRISGADAPCLACVRRGRLDAYGLQRRPGVSASSTASVFLMLLVLVGVGAARGQSPGPVVVSGYDPEEHGLFRRQGRANVQGWLYIQDGLSSIASTKSKRGRS